MASGGSDRICVDGKFFRLGDTKFYVKGVTYGPFAPNSSDQFFGSHEQTAQDFVQIRKLRANVVRIYHPPPKWFLELLGEYELKALIDIPWNKHLCFLDSAQHRADACDAV